MHNLKLKRKISILLLYYIIVKPLKNQGCELPQNVTITHGSIKSTWPYISLVWFPVPILNLCSYPQRSNMVPWKQCTWSVMVLHLFCWELRNIALRTPGVKKLKWVWTNGQIEENSSADSETDRSKKSLCLHGAQFNCLALIIWCPTNTTFLEFDSY